jgi:hypothetical protein
LLYKQASMETKKKITLKCTPDDIDVNSLGYLVPQALKLLLHDVT